MKNFIFVIHVLILIMSECVYSEENYYNLVKFCVPDETNCKVIKFDRNNKDHMYELGLLTSIGFGVQKDILLSADYFRIASELGHSGAQNQLCRYLDRYEENLPEAVKWCYLSKESGNKDAERYFYFLESTVKRDVIEEGISMAVSDE